MGDGQPKGGNTTAMEASWSEVKGRLRESLSQSAFNHWIRPLRFLGAKDGRVTLGAPSAFRCDQVVSQYHLRIRLLFKQIDPAITALDIIVDPMSQTSALERGPANGKANLDIARRPIPTSGANRLPPPRPVVRSGGAGDPLEDTSPIAHFTFDGFVVGRQNELAAAAARAVAERPATSYNPLFIHCPSGLGKTHLLNAIGNAALAANPSVRVACVTSEKFMYHYVNSAREGDTNAFKDRIRSVDMLIVDDLQFICGRDGTVREFTQTFNALTQAGKQVIVSADKPPIELPGLDAHIRSRLAGGLTVKIEAPDYDLRLSVLKSKVEKLRAQHPRLDIPDAILDFLARRIESNLRELEGGLKCVAHNTELSGRAISMEKAQELIRHFFRGNDRRISIEDIQKQVAAYYRVSMKDLLSHRRDRTIVRPRQVAMYLCKEMTTRSLPEIGRRFGGRDHTTVLYGVRKIGKMVGEDKALAEEVSLIKSILEN